MRIKRVITLQDMLAKTRAELGSYLESSLTSSMKPESHLGHTKSFEHQNNEIVLKGIFAQGHMCEEDGQLQDVHCTKAAHALVCCLFGVFSRRLLQVCTAVHPLHCNNYL